MERTYTFLYHDPERVRLDIFLSHRLEEISRSQIRRLILKRNVLLNGKAAKAGSLLSMGDVIKVHIPPPEPPRFEPEDIPLKLLYEDEWILVINKPPGLVAHPAPGHPRGTLVNALLAHCPEVRGVGGEERAGLVHRLDKDTSGLMVIAKNECVHRHLTLQFAAHRVKKEYLALVYGEFKETRGSIRLPLGRDPSNRKRFKAGIKGGRNALTHWIVLQSKDNLSLLRLILETGRTHQARVHLHSIGHPVIGDPVYGGKRVWARLQDPNVKDILKSVSRQLLHAEGISFLHPVSEEKVSFRAPLPDDMASVLERLGMDVK